MSELLSLASGLMIFLLMEGLMQVSPSIDVMLLIEEFENLHRVLTRNQRAEARRPPCCDSHCARACVVCMRSTLALFGWLTILHAPLHLPLHAVTASCGQSGRASPASHAPSAGEGGAEGRPLWPGI